MLLVRSLELRGGLILRELVGGKARLFIQRQDTALPLLTSPFVQSSASLKDPADRRFALGLSFPRQPDDKRVDSRLKPPRKLLSWAEEGSVFRVRVEELVLKSQ